MKFSKELLRFYLIPLILLAGILLTAGFTFFYTMTVRTPEGKITSSREPMDFTIDYAQFLEEKDELISPSKEGLALLDEQGLWLQILDSEGNETYQYHKPDQTPNRYRPYELLRLYQSGTDDFSVFISNTSVGGASCTYLIGFPLSISKVTLYTDNERYRSGKLLIVGIAIATVALLLFLTVYYNLVLTRNLSHILTSLKAIALRKYKPTNPSGFLKEIYSGINQLNRDIQEADLQRAQDERAREEWLTNITHDLKTPLVPIRGYAELLKENSQLTSEEIHNYGAVMLKNSLITEQLIDDLKLTYQLKSNLLPLNRKSDNLVSFVREIIIDLLNCPEYENRSIDFCSDKEDIPYSFDDRLLRRALCNVLVNALKHNTADTEIRVTLSTGDTTVITVADNGIGMSEEELNGLFTRYYRGTNAESKTEGSGLGMAITKQSIEAHGGKITAESALNHGTTITILLN